MLYSDLNNVYIMIINIKSKKIQLLGDTIQIQ